MAISTSPDITLVVAAFNVADYLDSFFDSIYQQSYQNYRLIFVDDCSTDGSFEKALALGERLGERFLAVQNPEHAGLVAVRNQGLELAEMHPSTYLTFLDVDDWFEPAYLQDLYDTAEKCLADVCIAGIVRFDDVDGSVLATEMVGFDQVLFEEAPRCADLAYVNPCSYAKLFRASAVRGLRFRSIARSEDTCYLFDSLTNRSRIAFTNHAWYHYRVRSDSLSDTLDGTMHASMHDEFALILPSFDEGACEACRDLFVAQAFIRSSIGAVLRRCKREGDVSAIAKEERAWLDACLDGWRTNPYLAWTHARGHGRVSGGTLSKRLAVKLCASLYKVGLFSLFVRAYRSYARYAHREVRW